MRWITAFFIAWACVCFFAWCLANASKQREECAPQIPDDFPSDPLGEDYTLFRMKNNDDDLVWGEVVERNGIPMSVRYFDDIL